jgi:hypothetical protein
MKNLKIQRQNEKHNLNIEAKSDFLPKFKIKKSHPLR